MKKYIYGIDVGGTSIKFGLFDNESILLEKWEIHTDKTNNGQNIIKDIVKTIKRTTPNLSEVIGYGIGIPGPVIHNYIPVCVNLGWTNVDLKSALSDALQNDNVFVANDGNLATLGEASFGAARGYKDVAMLTLGTGLGSGIVVEHEIIEGYHGAAGEIGHLKIESKYNLPCNCGKENCLETVASATGIKNVFHRMKEDFIGESALLDYATPSAKSIFDYAKKGDKLALQVVDYVSYYIGYASHVISATTNPTAIVIGGGVSRAGDFLIDKINEHFNHFLFSPVKGTKLILATLGNDAGIYGGCQLVISHG